MSIRNAAIAMRKRKIGLHEQEERATSRGYRTQRRGPAAGTSANNSTAMSQAPRKTSSRQGSWADW